jgi:hypothetical protein
MKSLAHVMWAAAVLSTASDVRWVATAKLSKTSASQALANSPVQMHVGSKSFQLQLARTPERAIADARTLFTTVASAWHGVVDGHQAGLLPPKDDGRAQPPLSPAEAWHLYRRTQVRCSLGSLPNRRVA